MQTTDAETGSAPALHPIEDLAERIEAAKAAPFLHKGERAGEALAGALAVLRDLHGRLAVLEHRLNAIEHPPAVLPRRRADGRFLPE